MCVRCQCEATSTGNAEPLYGTQCVRPRLCWHVGTMLPLTCIGINAKVFGRGKLRPHFLNS